MLHYAVVACPTTPTLDIAAATDELFCFSIVMHGHSGTQYMYDVIVGEELNL